MDVNMNADISASRLTRPSIHNNTSNHHNSSHTGNLNKNVLPNGDISLHNNGVRTLRNHTGFGFKSVTRMPLLSAPHATTTTDVLLGKTASDSSVRSSNSGSPAQIRQFSPSRGRTNSPSTRKDVSVAIPVVTLGKPSGNATMKIPLTKKSLVPPESVVIRHQSPGRKETKSSHADMNGNAPREPVQNGVGIVSSKPARRFPSASRTSVSGAEGDRMTKKSLEDVRAREKKSVENGELQVNYLICLFFLIRFV